MNVANQNKSRRNMLLIIAVFILPVVLAKLALEHHWLKEAATNNGQLVTNGLTLAQLGVNHEKLGKKWLLTYVAASPCQQLCAQAMHVLNNTYVALGKDRQRVTPVSLTAQLLTAEQRAQQASSTWQRHPLPKQAWHYFSTPQVLIIDPLGNVVLRFQPPTTAQQLTLFGKSILTDFKKLLKYSELD